MQRKFQKKQEYGFLIASHAFNPGEAICSLGNEPCSKSDPKRLQINDTVYILPPYIISHSCDPNAYVDWNSNELKSLKRISKGDLISYHYGTSEDDYTEGEFNCICKSKLCLGRFRGFAYMTESERELIKNYISPYLKHKYFSFSPHD